MPGSNGDVVIVGAGIGGLTLALALHRAGIACRVFEAAPEMLPLGVGINVLPHASAELQRSACSSDARARGRRDARGGVLQSLRPARLQRAGRPLGRLRRAAALDPSRRPAGRAARGRARRGSAPTASSPASACVGVEQRRRDGVARDASRSCARGAQPRETSRRASPSACDGIHSAVRRQLYPDEGAAALLGRQHVARRDARTRRS